MSDERERLIERLRRGPKDWQNPEQDLLNAAAAALSQQSERIAELERRCQNQRTELRRLNKCLGPYWRGFNRGLSLEAVCNLRGVMNKAFGHEAVRAAEHAAIDAARGHTPAEGA
jgi:hypothetical protein